MINSDASAFVVSGYDGGKCKATTPIILHGGINSSRETSCIVHAGRAGAQSAYFVEKGIFPLDPRSQASEGKTCMTEL